MGQRYFDYALHGSSISVKWTKWTVNQTIQNGNIFQVIYKRNLSVNLM